MATFFHGANKIIERPTTDMIHYACGLGQGFYLTSDFNRGKEYAVSLKEDGYVSEYALNLDDYKVLDLQDDKYSPLNWVALLAANRPIDVESREALNAKHFLIDNYTPKGVYDIVVGCRCDGVYTRVATDFINGKLSYRNLCRMLNVGDADIQVAILKDRVISDLEFKGSTYISADEVFPKKERNNIKKLESYNKRLNATIKEGDKFIFDIMNNEVR